MGWWYYWQNNPDHHERADFRNAQLCTLLCLLKQDKIPKEHELLDFMPYSKMEKPRQTPEQAVMLLKAFAAKHNEIVNG